MIEKRASLRVDKAIQIRVNREDKYKWDYAAKRAGMSLARWIRAVLNERSVEPGLYLPIFDELNGQVEVPG